MSSLTIGLVRVALLGVGGIVVAAATANAQALDRHTMSCIDAIPDSALVPAVVYLHPGEGPELDSAAMVRRDEIDIFTQLVADRMRSLLHAAPGTVPAGEPAVTWRTRETGARIVVDREGRFTAHALAADDSLRTVPARKRSTLLADALDSLRADGERLAFAAGPADSVAFTLTFVDAQFDASGKVVPPPVRLAFPVASLRVPRERLPRLVSSTPPQYPERQRRENYEGTIVMQFVVDTTGHVDPSTVRDLWPASLPRLTGLRKASYDAFLGAIHRHLGTAVFEPARIGDCVVRQLVQQPYTFGLVR